MSIVIATIKSWNLLNAEKLKERSDKPVHICSSKEQLTPEWLDEIDAEIIFFPHWSWIIPAEIYNSYQCIVFHMTDLPYGRGGSPLQNLIIQGHSSTKISAIKVVKEVDAGPVYLKTDLDISNGSAQEIFINASNIVFQQMIPTILNGDLFPVEQEGEPVFFKRRTPKESNLKNIIDVDEKAIYDFIRMLDGEGYPKAYIEFGDKKILFSNVTFQNGKLSGSFEVTDE